MIGYVQIKLSPITGKIDVRELGYAMSKEYRRRGYMSEAVNAVTGCRAQVRFFLCEGARREETSQVLGR